MKKFIILTFLLLLFCSCTKQISSTTNTSQSELSLKASEKDTSSNSILSSSDSFSSLVESVTSIQESSKNQTSLGFSITNQDSGDINFNSVLIH